MILTSDLKARVEKEVGTEICPVFFTRAEQYARQKLDRINERAGRKYGEDGYGDEYLVLLTADTVREMAFSEYTFIMIELFARTTASGWDAWGDEVEGGVHE